MKFILQKGVIFILFFITMFSYGQKIKINDVRNELHKFLISTNDAIKEQSIDHPTLFIYDCINKKLIFENDLPECQIGFFRFTTMSPHSYMHFLILYEGSGYIINMKQPLDRIIKELIRHLKRAQDFTKDRSLFCVDEVIYWELYNINNTGGIRLD